MATPSRSAEVTADIAAVPLKHEPHWLGVLPVEVRHHRCSDGHRAVLGEDRDRAAAQPAVEAAQRLVVERDVKNVAVQQAGEVAAHQHAVHLIGRHAVEVEQLGERQAVRNLVERRAACPRR